MGTAQTDHANDAVAICACEAVGDAIDQPIKAKARFIEPIVGEGRSRFETLDLLDALAGDLDRLAQDAA